MIVGSKTYATEVEDVIEHKLHDALFCVLYSISKKFECLGDVFDCDTAVAYFKSNKYEEIYEEVYAAKFRDLAIQFFEELGFDVQPDGKDY